MSGVIDDNGQQWEHCNICNKFIEIEKLYYIQPTVDHPYGLDACRGCYSKHLTKHINILRQGVLCG